MNDSRRRHQRIRSILEQAYDLETSARDAFVRSACGTDEELRNEIERYLDDTTRGGHPVDSEFGAIGWVSSLVAGEPDGELRNYRLREILGVGSFGVVYLADQLEPIRRQVALKILKPGMDTLEFVGRFRQERQALASMNHPAVAVIYDGGATDAGLPYFAMEFVDGQPIDDYVERHRLTARETVTLFLEALAGVRHAHQRGVVHRDLKPSHILVAEIDGRPRPKIIDFGIAKSTGGTERPFQTEAGRAMGTLGFMSPEQARGAGDVDARSDLFSLAVILTRLLTGEMPFEPLEGRPSELPSFSDRPARIDPVAIERRWGRAGDHAHHAARALAKTLRRALSVDPGARQHSVADFAAELERAIDPVHESPSSRSRVAWVAAGFAVLLTILGLVWGRPPAAPPAASGSDPIGASISRMSAHETGTDDRDRITAGTSPTAVPAERPDHFVRTPIPPAVADPDLTFDGVRDVAVLVVRHGPSLETWEFRSGPDTWELRDRGGPDVPGAYRIAFDSGRGVTVLFAGEVEAPEGRTWEWDGTRWTPCAAQAAPPRRATFGMCHHPGLGAVVVFGGTAPDDPDHASRNDLWAWDGSEWRELPDDGERPPRRFQATLCHDPIRDRLITCGGWVKSNDATGDTWFWKAGRWTRGPEFPVPGFHDCVFDQARNRAVVLGNYQAWRGELTFELDADLESWVQVAADAPGGIMRESPALAYDPGRARVLAFGGTGRYPGDALASRSDLHAWDGTTWSQVSSGLPEAVWEPHFALDTSSDSAVLRTFGWTSPLWRHRSGRWQALGFPVASQPPTHLTGTGFVGLEDGRLLTFGGLAQGAATAQTWLWRGTAWVRVDGTESPSARYEHAMAPAIVEGRRIAMLFGGRTAMQGDDAALDDLWIYDGGWSRVLRGPEDVWPAARSRATAAWDPDRQAVMMFGGCTGARSNRTETWTWNPADRSWNLLNLGSGPTNTVDQTMVHDPRTQRMLLVGPEGVWEWTEGAWRSLGLLGLPEGQRRPAAVFDPQSRCLRVFGGDFAVPMPGAEWTW